ncbi:MAG: type II 3-dehydroquinate dehydratase [Bacteroidetes bacterium]|nr:type II 3-dehydroquinate dehydratase [Bacteroidota bacterium]MBL7104219.1 type II 3-dehydroquinate dehydratase [Bacteroidales bacterium]
MHCIYREFIFKKYFTREDFRRVSLIGAYAKGSIIGFGLESYRLALKSFKP